MATEKLEDIPAYIWGQVFGALDIALKGLDDRILIKACVNPVVEFGQVVKRNKAKISAEHDYRIGELVSRLKPDIVRLTDDEQSSWWLGYYHESGGKTGRAGAPKKEDRVDYSKVDWSKSNAENSRILDISPQAVAAARKRYAPETIPEK